MKKQPNKDLARRFAEEYVLCFDVALAYRRADRDAPETECAVYGARLKRNSFVQDLICKYMELQTKRCIVSREMIIDGLLTEANYRGENSSHAARVSAWEKLGKIREIGLFEDKVKLEGNAPPTVYVNIANKDKEDDIL